jgi:ADP-ribose pyrophosphatase YjhB (NUDIX family)
MTDSGVSREGIESWVSSLAAIAQTGLSFTESLYEKERYEEILRVVARMRVAIEEGDGPNSSENELYQELLSAVGKGVHGYITPKCAVGAVVIDDRRRMLMVKRADSGVWLYPTGWADVGYSPAEVVIKEVTEETGIRVKPERLLGVIDGMRRGFTSVAMYSMIFLCRPISGELRAHPLETSDVGWFGLTEMPQPTRRLMEQPWLKWVFDGSEPTAPYFDSPRSELEF